VFLIILAVISFKYKKDESIFIAKNGIAIRIFLSSLGIYWIKRWVLIQRYFCKGYDYGGKAELRKTYWSLKRKMWVATQFLEIIKQL